LPIWANSDPYFAGIVLAGFLQGCATASASWRAQSGGAAAPVTAGIPWSGTGNELDLTDTSGCQMS